MMEEKLTLDRLLPMAQARAEELMQVICEKEKILKKAPAGRLRLARRGCKAHYFHVTKNSSEWGDYIPAGESAGDAAIAALAQKDYDILALREINEEIEVLQKCLLKYHPHQLDSLYEESNEGRRKYLKPLYEPDELFDKKWLEKEYYHMEFSEDAPEYYTQQGERVRSKSEMIIADRLYSKGIPYRYEYPLNLQDGYTVHTDFYCLQRRTRKEIPWEHFGMMDQEEYVITAVKKIESYAKTGYILGRNFLATFETAYSPLNVKTVDAIIEQVLL